MGVAGADGHPFRSVELATPELLQPEDFVYLRDVSKSWFIPSGEPVVDRLAAHTKLLRQLRYGDVVLDAVATKLHAQVFCTSRLVGLLHVHRIADH